MGIGIAAARDEIREKVAFQEQDRAMIEDIEVVVEMIETGRLVVAFLKFFKPCQALT